MGSPNGMEDLRQMRRDVHKIIDEQIDKGRNGKEMFKRLGEQE